MKSSRNWYKMLSIKKVSLSEHWIWNMGRKGCLRRRLCWRQLISMCCLKRLRRRRKFLKKILFKLRYLWYDCIGCFFEDLQCELETRQLETTNRRKINAISKNPQDLNRRTQSLTQRINLDQNKIVSVIFTVICLKSGLVHLKGLSLRSGDDVMVYFVNDLILNVGI